MEKELPNKSGAVVENNKLVEYLLNIDHVEGGGKAKFFISKGFKKEDLGVVELLRQVLLKHARTNNVVKIETNGYVTKYIIEGPVEYVMEKVVNVYTDENNHIIEEIALRAEKIYLRTVWGIDNKINIPKLITAYALDYD